MPLQPQDRLTEVAGRAARAAAAVLMERFADAASGVASKSSRTDLVSDADRAAERAVLAVLAEERPDDAIVAEEGGGAAGSSGLRWVVDPLDGTINYLWGLPFWAVSVAVEDDAGALAAVVLDPLRDELFEAARSRGAHLGERRLAVREGDDPAEALTGTGFSYSADQRALQAARLATTLPRLRDVRRFGAAALDLAWVAAGRLDAFFETGLAPWDWAAGALLVREAGGVVRELTPRDGSPACVVAAGPGLIGPLVSVIDGAGAR